MVGLLVSATAPDVEAYRLMSAGRFADALIPAEQAVSGKSVCVPAHGLLATILLRLGRVTEAERVVVSALEMSTGSADAYDALAHVSMLLGEHERSNALYRRVVELDGSDPRFWYNLASSERSFGRLQDAEAACNKAIILDDACYAAYLLRSELRVQSDTSNHVDELQRLLNSRGAAAGARVPLGYALAKELDDLGRFDEAFHWFALAATARRQQLVYDVAVDEHKLLRIAEAFPCRTEAPEIKRDESGRYIFIVGLPRSGTTLVEHILTGLPNVRSNGETDNFARALMAASPMGASDVFASAAHADYSAVATNYHRLAARAHQRGMIIEKMPLNYLYLGAIHRALPESRILLVQRQPLDSCFAMYRTLFGAAYPFSYDFDDLARYYAAYDRLTRHWQNCLGDSIMTVNYEELVAQPLRVGERLAEHCGLQWDPGAIQIHRSASVSFTASAAQIRRPIYGSSSGRWRHYRSHLEPLIKALRDRKIPVPEHS